MWNVCNLRSHRIECCADSDRGSIAIGFCDHTLKFSYTQVLIRLAQQQLIEEKTVELHIASCRLLFWSWTYGSDGYMEGRGFWTFASDDGFVGEDNDACTAIGNAQKSSPRTRNWISDIVGPCLTWSSWSNDIGTRWHFRWYTNSQWALRRFHSATKSTRNVRNVPPCKYHTNEYCTRRLFGGGC